MKVSDTLQKAKEVLLEQGWLQGCYERNEDGMALGEPGGNAVCLAGAVYTAEQVESYFGTHADTHSIWFLRNYMVKHYKTYIADFNDVPTRTLSEVLDLLDEVTVAAKEQGL